MKIKTINLIYLFSLATIFLACEKDEIPVYIGEDMVNINYRGMNLNKDTIYISYGFVQSQQEIINLELLLTGYAREYDREVGIQITSEDGAEKGIHYEFPSPIIMPKGEVQSTVPLTILRPNDLSQDGAKSFLLEIQNSKDLQSGIRATLYVHISDEIPDKWIGDENWFMNPVSQYFGECSKTKYLFVYQNLNVWDFDDWSYFGMMGDDAKFLPAKRILKEKLAEYEQEHGPLIDPDKGRVTFPN